MAFVRTLWFATRTLVCRGTRDIYQNDIEACIAIALWGMTTAYMDVFREGFFARPQHWVALVQVVKDMIKAQYKRGFYDLTVEQLRGDYGLEDDENRWYWMPMVEEAAEWVLDDDWELDGVEESVENDGVGETVLESVENNGVDETVLESVENNGVGETVLESVENDDVWGAVLESIDNDGMGDAILEAIKNDGLG